MGCCGNSDNDNDRPVYVKPAGQMSKRNVGLTERRNRLMVCMTCPNRIQEGDKAGINKRDYCDWDKKRIRNKVKDGSESCYKGIWPIYEPGMEPRDELGLVEKAGLLASAISDVVTSNYVDADVMEKRRSECLTCVYRIPKHSDQVYDPNVIQETDICGICTCPVLSITKLASKSCPDNPSKWGKE